MLMHRVPTRPPPFDRARHAARWLEIDRYASRGNRRAGLLAAIAPMGATAAPASLTLTSKLHLPESLAKCKRWGVSENLCNLPEVRWSSRKEPPWTHRHRH
jgi:hypothetical protein